MSCSVISVCVARNQWYGANRRQAPHGLGTGLGCYQPGYHTSRQGCSQDLFLGLLSRHAWSRAEIERSREERDAWEGADTVRPADDIDSPQVSLLHQLCGESYRYFELVTRMCSTGTWY